MVRVGKTSRLVFDKGGTAATSLPINRNGFPSMRTMLVNRWARPVQWVVLTSVSLSAWDQILKYGSHATSGTAGGRNGADAACAQPARQAQIRTSKVRQYFFIIE